jgi:hypothetical protein
MARAFPYSSNYVVNDWWQQGAGSANRDRFMGRGFGGFASNNSYRVDPRETAGFSPAPQRIDNGPIRINAGGAVPPVQEQAPVVNWWNNSPQVAPAQTGGYQLDPRENNPAFGVTPAPQATPSPQRIDNGPIRIDEGGVVFGNGQASGSPQVQIPARPTIPQWWAMPGTKTPQKFTAAPEDNIRLDPRENDPIWSNPKLPPPPQAGIFPPLRPGQIPSYT